MFSLYHRNNIPQQRLFGIRAVGYKQCTAGAHGHVGYRQYNEIELVKNPRIR